MGWQRVGRVALLALALFATATGCSDEGGTPKLAAPPTTVSVAAPSDPNHSTVAEALVPRVAVYDREGGTIPVQTIGEPTDPPRPLVFLVQEEKAPLWLKVLLPVRPNGSTGWIKATDVRLTEHRYRITIRLTEHRLTVTNNQRIILKAPIGVGTAKTPTPGGLYYTKELLRPPKPDGVYGPYAYGLSGFSNELTTFDGGDGVIGIHGTNDPAGLGQDVSHGCIRMPNADITKLVEQVKLPLGVPVEIVA
jgi:lipoprotein-anchoring transpeptidase ErfK/SrfK